MVVNQSGVPSIPPTLGEALLSALGYFVVAVACTLAGYSVGHLRFLPLSGEWPTFVLFFSVLFPTYANRAILYELKLGDFGDHAVKLAWLRAFSIQVPLLLLVEGGGLATLFFFCAGPPVGSSFIRVLTRIVVTVAPMYCISGRLTLRWPKDDSLFAFLHRSFFPAFATCLTPFVFGYAGYGDTKCCVWSAACVLLYWSMSFWLPVRLLACVGSVWLVGFALEQVFWMNATTAGARCARVIFFGTLMTLAMGVSESWRVTTKILRNTLFRKGGVYTARDKSFYLGGANLATALFLPCFLLTALHPSTTGFYLIMIFVLLAIQYICWFIDSVKTRIPWPTFGITSGFILPVVIVFGTQFPRTESWQSPLVLPTDLGSLIAIITFDLVLVGGLTSTFWRSTLKRKLPDGYSHLSYLEPAIPCICITGGLSGVLSIAIAIAAHLLPVSAIEKPRVAALNELYLAAALLCFFVVSIISYKPKMQQIFRRTNPGPSGSESRNDRSTSFAHIVRGALRLTRPASSMIAGTLSALIVLRGIGSASVAARAGFAITFATMFGFVLDDVDDLPADCLVGKETALTSGQISTHAAQLLSLCLGVAAVLLSAGGAWGRVVIATTLILLGCYYRFSRALPSLKGLYTATLACVPLFYGGLVSHLQIPDGIYVALWCFVAGRELFIDSHQADADRRTGLKTLAVRWKRQTAELVARVVMLVAITLLVVSANSANARMLGIVAVGTVIWVLYGPISPSRRPALLRVSLVLGACVIAMIL